MRKVDKNEQRSSTPRGKETSPNSTDHWRALLEKGLFGAIVRYLSKLLRINDNRGETDQRTLIKSSGPLPSLDSPRRDGGDVDDSEEGGEVGPPAEAVPGRDGGYEQPHRDLRRKDQHGKRLLRRRPPAGGIESKQTKKQRQKKKKPGRR